MAGSKVGQLLDPSTNSMINSGTGALNTSAESNAATKSGESMANTQIGNSDKMSKANEAMNTQAMLNNARKAASELLKGAI
ncbi:hypothetical protein [Piscinibacter terrae]|nr:hypothetical protein [Albitalea terrae]